MRGGRGLARRRAAVGALAAGALLAACAGQPEPEPSDVLHDRAITVSSFDFPESELIGELYAGALEEAGFLVDRRLSIGPRELVSPALERGLVEVIPEYLGSALSFARAGAEVPRGDPGRVSELLDAELHARNLDVLSPSQASDANGLAVTEATARRLGLETITDLAPWASSLTFGGPPECATRPLCLPGLKRVYGLRFERVVALDVSGPLTEAALANGEIDVGLLFTTDASIAERGFVLLRDDRRLQPPENVVPIVRREAVDRFGPEFVAAIEAVSSALRQDELIEMNRLIESEGLLPVEVARAWLRSHPLRG